MVDCKSPESADNRVAVVTSTTFGSTVLYSCEKGYTLQGSNNSQCQASGRWTEEPSCTCECACTVHMCELAKYNIYMAMLMFKCILLLYIPSLCWDVLVSDFSMIFSFILLTVVDCGTPEMPTNGAIDLRSTTFDSTVQYACNTGYSLVGQNTSVCQADGEWSSRPPSCEGEWRSASTHTHTHEHTHTHTRAHTQTHSEVSVLWLL